MTNLKIEKEHLAFARQLRQHSTDAERLLWSQLRRNALEGIKFKRQHPIGPYIVDFVTLENMLVVEIDGGQHNEPKGQQRDKERTEWLEGKGYRVLRFWNNDVLTNIEGVFEMIRQALVLDEAPLFNSLPIGGEITSPRPERERHGRGRALEKGE
ncbi:MAG: methylase [Dehalococcoidia bacterium]|nr:methylase [Dehalococcoidia bacterium]